MEQDQRDDMMSIHLRANQLLTEQSDQQGASKGKLCPYCGGHAIPNYELCQNCASPLAWVEGYPCKLGEDKLLAQALELVRKKTEKGATEEQEMDEKTKKRDWKSLLKKTGSISIFASLISLLLECSGKDTILFGCFTFIGLSFFGWLIVGTKSIFKSILKVVVAIAALYVVFKIADAISQVVVGSKEKTRQAIESMNEIQRKYGRPNGY